MELVVVGRRKTSSMYLNVEFKVTTIGLFFSCRRFSMISAS
jgi:hypothetical protein